MSEGNKKRRFRERARPFFDLESAEVDRWRFLDDREIPSVWSTSGDIEFLDREGRGVVYALEECALSSASTFSAIFVSMRISTPS